MIAGKLDNKVSIESRTPTKDTLGGEIYAWAEITDGEVWADVQDLAGNEKYEASRITEKADKRIIMRWRSDITPDMRISFNSEYYGIYSIRAIGGRQDGLEIMAKQLQDPKNG